MKMRYIIAGNKKILYAANNFKIIYIKNNFCFVYTEIKATNVI